MSLLQTYYFVGEYVTSIHVMYEMEQGGFAGLKTDDKNLQATHFLVNIQNILNSDKECSHRFRIIYYKGTYLKIKNPTTQTF